MNLILLCNKNHAYLSGVASTIEVNQSLLHYPPISLNCIVKTGISGQVVRITATAGQTLELAEVAVYGFGEFAAAY